MTVRCRRSWPLLVLWLTAAPLPASAADAEGRFAVDGVTTQSCRDFSEAHADRDSPRAAFMIGWLAGLISGTNVHAPKTYDLTPWETIELLGLKLDRYCMERPDDRFAEAALRLVATLAADRLERESPLVSVRYKDQAVYIYAEVLSRVAERLQQAGHPIPTPPGSFDNDFAKAIIDYQRAHDLPRTGLPDQVTLNLLMR